MEATALGKKLFHSLVVRAPALQNLPPNERGIQFMTRVSGVSGNAVHLFR